MSVSLEEALRTGLARMRGEGEEAESRIPIILPSRACVPPWIVSLIQALMPVAKQTFPQSHQFLERHQWVMSATIDAIRRQDKDQPNWVHSPLERYTLDVLIQTLGGSLYESHNTRPSSSSTETEI